MDNESVTINFRRAEQYKSLVISQGYIWDDVADLPLHRVVAEDCIGHTIASGMNVHHIDHVKKNNTPKNLIVVSEWVHMLLHAAYHYGFFYGPGSLLVDPVVLVTRLRAEGIPFEWCGEDNANS